MGRADPRRSLGRLNNFLGAICRPSPKYALEGPSKGIGVARQTPEQRSCPETEGIEASRLHCFWREAIAEVGWRLSA
jgi:hypothetical protein